jgi:hypothetical protein
LGTSGATSSTSAKPFSRARLDDRQRPIEQYPQVELDAVELQPARFHARQIEYVVDDRDQRLPRIVHRDHVFALLLAERRLEQHAGHADDPVHRLADLVAHGGEKQGLGLVRLLRRDTGLAHRGQLAPQVVDSAAAGVVLGRRQRARPINAISRHGSPSLQARASPDLTMIS